MYFHFTFSPRSLGELTCGFFPFLEHLTLSDHSLFNTAQTSELTDSIAAEGILVEGGPLGHGNDAE